MKISLQSQLLSLISLLLGLIIFSALGMRYFGLQELQLKVNSLAQASYDINHVQTMQQQWLTTLDLFLNDKQSYLAKGINNQTSQLSKKYQQITTYADMPESAEVLNAWLATINKGTQKLAYATTHNAHQWRQFIVLSDELTQKLLDTTDHLSLSIKQRYKVRSLELASSHSQLTNIALVLLTLYVIVSFGINWWNSHTLVKPLEKLSQLATQGINTDEEPDLTIDEGPTEIRQLSQSLQHYSSGLKQQQRMAAKAHHEEQQTRQRLSAVMDTAPSAIITTDHKLNILTLNAATLRLFSLSKERLLHASLSTLIPNLMKVETRLDQLIDFQAEINSKNTLLSIEISSAGLNQQGQIQYLFMIKDISPRKAQENEMKRLSDQLVQSEKLASIGQLAAGVAHEINNPIGFVKSNVEMLADYFHSFEQYIDAFKEIKAAIDHQQVQKALANIDALRESLDIEYLINDSTDIFESSKKGLQRVCKIVQKMKTFSQVEKDEQQLENLENLIEQAIALTANEFKYKAVVVTDYSQLTVIKCWKTKLLQVLINLLINAAHAIDEQGCINIKTYQKGNLAMIDILDNGSGINEDTLKNIFTPFFTTKPAGQATGLGLHVSQSIMAKHGGEITVKTEVGTGTCFTLSLPTEGVLIYPLAE